MSKLMSLKEFRFADKVTLYAIDIQCSKHLELFPGFHGLCENPYINTVCRIGERLDKELVIGFMVDVTAVTAINFYILNPEFTQVAE